MNTAITESREEWIKRRASELLAEANPPLTQVQESRRELVVGAILVLALALPFVVVALNLVEMVGVRTGLSAFVCTVGFGLSLIYWVKGGSPNLFLAVLAGLVLGLTIG